MEIGDLVKEPIEIELDVIKCKIEDLEEGLMEIAKTVGRLRAELKLHKETPDAHNPATIQKITKEQAY